MTTLRILTDDGFILKDVNDNEFYWCNKYAEKTEDFSPYAFYNGFIWYADNATKHINLRDEFLPKIRKVKKSETYVALKSNLALNATDKAFGIPTGTNNKHGSNYKVFYEYVAFSICKEIDNKTYCPLWIANNSQISDNFEFNDKITIKL